MIVQIKEYSGKTGKGTAIDPKGGLISFTYKQFQDQKAIPIGKKAELVLHELIPAGKAKTLLFYVYKLINYMRGKLCQ